MNFSILEAFKNFQTENVKSFSYGMIRYIKMERDEIKMERERGNFVSKKLCLCPDLESFPR